MSSTTRRVRWRALGRPLGRLLVGLATMLAVWIAVLALVMHLGGPSPEALVLLPSAGFAARLPDGVALIDASRLGLTVRAGSPEAGRLVPALYGAGAWLVLPAGLSGCLGLRT